MQAKANKVYEDVLAFNTTFEDTKAGLNKYYDNDLTYDNKSIRENVNAAINLAKDALTSLQENGEDRKTIDETVQYAIDSLLGTTGTLVGKCTTKSNLLLFTFY